MLRTHTNGELRLENAGQTVTLVGWVQRTRDKGSLLWIDLRDRYGLTQITLEEGVEAEAVRETARHLGREFVLQRDRHGSRALLQERQNARPAALKSAPVESLRDSEPRPSCRPSSSKTKPTAATTCG